MLFTGSVFQFTGYLQDPFFNLHVIDRLPFSIYKLIMRSLFSIDMLFTGSLFQFTGYLQAPLFQFTVSLQATVFDLHVLDMLFTAF